VEAQLEVFEGLSHVQYLYASPPATREVFEEIAAFFDVHLGNRAVDLLADLALERCHREKRHAYQSACLALVDNSDNRADAGAR
jgi:hypothetical protein